MISKANLTVGNTAFQFEFENADEMESMHRAIAVASIPTFCNICEGEANKEDFKLTTNKDKDGNFYVNLKHQACGGSVKLGQYKSGGYFWHSEFSQYKPKSKEENE